MRLSIILKNHRPSLRPFRKSIPAVEPINTTSGRVLLFLGQANYEKKNFPGALDNYARAAALFEDIVQADPQNNLPVEKLAQAYKYTGDAHRDFAKTLAGPQQQKHAREAKESYGRALGVYSGMEGASHPLPIWS